MDGVVQQNEVEPIPNHSNRYAGLSEVEDKLTFTQNRECKNTTTRENSPEQKNG
jgi:hypothetical protein